jgi:hypothetical protein
MLYTKNDKCHPQHIPLWSYIKHNRIVILRSHLEAVSGKKLLNLQYFCSIKWFVEQ